MRRIHDDPTSRWYFAFIELLCVVVKAEHAIDCIAERRHVIALKQELGNQGAAVIWVANWLCEQEGVVNRRIVAESEMAEGVVQHVLQTLNVEDNVLVEHRAL
jgi:hypothetical protein